MIGGIRFRRSSAAADFSVARAASTAAESADKPVVVPEDPITAYDREHWSFSPLKRPELPAVKSGDWCRTPVDRFILARLEKAGLTPLPPADRGTLIRRLTFDLTGLPPTPAEIDAFVDDTAPGAYEKLLDRLLADERVQHVEPTRGGCS